MAESAPAGCGYDRECAVVDWALTHGIIMKQRCGTEGAVVHAPTTLRPFKLAANAFETVVQLAPLFNSMVDKIARDSDWLLARLANTAQYDEFTGRLYRIFQQVLEEGIKQQTYMGIHRSDYMMHDKEDDPRDILQVELNTIASSFGALSTRIAEMFQQLRFPDALHEQVPTNAALYEIANAIAAAHQHYCSQTSLQSAIVVMVVQPNERNISDQRLVEFELLSKHGIVMQRATLDELHQFGSVDDGTFAFKFKGLEVAVVYYRAGYTPDDYPSENEWSARLSVERSRAIKCPNIAYHLAGTKKVQQVLVGDGELERFCTSAEEGAQLRKVFAGLFTLDNKDGKDGDAQAAVQAAMANPSGFVMKPQREGGGNNFYGQQVVDALNSMPEGERSAYILMERIMPHPATSTLIRNTDTVDAECICELGIFGTYLGDGTTEYTNKYAGYLLRVKSVESNEGGVAAGYAFLSSPALT